MRSRTRQRSALSLRLVSRCQYYLAQSLDGYLAERDGGIGWLTGYQGEANFDDASALAGPGPMPGGYDEFFAGVGAIAMGSATFEWLLGNVDDWPYPDTPCWVFSSRELNVPDGADVRFASGEPAPAYEDMRAAAGRRTVWMMGGGDLAIQFARVGLLDEVIVTIVPVVLGEGRPTFPGRLEQSLQLRAALAYGNGMVQLRYDVRNS